MSTTTKTTRARTTDHAHKKGHEAGTEVAEAKNTAIALPTIDFGEDAGMGTENVDASSAAIPFLTILQGLSPQIETVDGAKPGLFINTITNEMFKEVEIVPCYFQRRFLRWAPNRGGYKGDFSAIDVETNKVPGMSVHDGHYLMDVPEGAAAFDKDGKPAFDHLSDTRNHFVLMRSAGGNWIPALVSMSSTQIKKSKRLIALILGIELERPNGSKFNPPSFSHIYKMKAVKEKNAKGEWWAYDISLERQLDTTDANDVQLYMKAKDFSQQVGAGKVEVAQPVQEEATGNGFDSGDDKF